MMNGREAADTDLSNAAAAERAAAEAEGAGMPLAAPPRDEQVMLRFLEGTLNVGPSFTLQRHGKPITFLPKGQERRALMQWYDDHGIENNNRSVNARLVISNNPLPEGRRLSNEPILQKAPFDRVEVLLMPTKNESITGKKRGSCQLQTHEVYADARVFSVCGTGRLKGDVGLLRLVQDTVKHMPHLVRESKKEGQPSLGMPWRREFTTVGEVATDCPPVSMPEANPNACRASAVTSISQNTPHEMVHTANEAVAYLLRDAPSPHGAHTHPQVAAQIAIDPALHMDRESNAVPRKDTSANGGMLKSPKTKKALRAVLSDYYEARARLFPPTQAVSLLREAGHNEALPMIAVLPSVTDFLQLERGRHMLDKFGVTEEEARLALEHCHEDNEERSGPPKILKRGRSRNEAETPDGSSHSLSFLASILAPGMTPTYSKGNPTTSSTKGSAVTLSEDAQPVSDAPGSIAKSRKRQRRKARAVRSSSASKSDSFSTQSSSSKSATLSTVRRRISTQVVSTSSSSPSHQAMQD